MHERAENILDDSGVVRGQSREDHPRGSLVFTSQAYARLDEVGQLRRKMYRKDAERIRHLLQEQHGLGILHDVSATQPVDLKAAREYQCVQHLVV